MPFEMIDFWQALAAGILVGSAYALMCVGLNIIFGAMRVINFAQGDFLMLGMYAAFYLTAGYGVLSFLGPYAGPIVAAFLAGPIVFAVGWLVHRFIVSRVTGAGVADVEGAGHYGQILVTLGISLILTNGGLILFGSTPVGVRTPLSRQSWEIGDVLLNQARVGELHRRDRGGGRGLSVPRPYAGRQGIARRRRQPAGGDLYGDRRRSGASDRLEPRGRRSPRSPAVSSRRFRPFSPISGSTSSSSCMPGSCSAGWAAISARSGAVS